MLRKSVTQQYPEVKPALPARSRGVIALVEENCTSCMLCARECPDWCIYIDSHKETLPAPEGGRPRQRNVLDRFAIDFALCMYCGICVEVCPFDALFWSPEFEYAGGDLRDLLHEKDTLAGWARTVPPPPAHDPGAEPPKELTAAPRRPTPRTTPSTPTRDTPTPRTTPSAPTRDTPTRPARPAAAPAPDQDPASGAAGGSPEPGRPARARRATTDVRAIRPPGALPPQPTDETPAPRTPEAGTPDDQAPHAPSATTTDAQLATTGAESATTRPAGTQPADQRPADQRPAGQRPADQPPAGGEPPHEASSSTGEPTSEKLSTASGEPQSEPDPGVQTAAPSPRRRRMADPRSIRPPGRLGPDDPKESEEES
ncbi:4Fe-4S binding protein [Nonomuraea sp. NPDC050783]|uniref:4Fe-4S binding protein n=1 Tax=Nonomuraea sp. NPDC050783 TaxID=3154634 RepID=UPI0034661DA1